MVPHERSLVNKLKDRPFALVGVQCFDKPDVARKFAEKHRINWRSFFDEAGEIAKEWNVRGFPTLMLIDHEGKFRSLDFRPAQSGVDPMIEELLKKAEAAAQN